MGDKLFDRGEGSVTAFPTSYIKNAIDHGKGAELLFTYFIYTS